MSRSLSIESDEAHRCSAVLQRYLCNPEPQVPWKQLWKLLRLWERVSSTQKAIVERAQEHLQLAEEDGLRKDLLQIINDNAGERDRHFHLAMFWRRHAVWRVLHRNPIDIDTAFEIHSKIFNLSTVQTEDSAVPRHLSPVESAQFRKHSDKCLNRLKRIKRWFEEHPEVRDALKDTKGKGKQREPQESGINAKGLQALIAHIRCCLSEIEQPSLLSELARSTQTWLEAFENRIIVMQTARAASSPKFDGPVVPNNASVRSSHTGRASGSPSVKRSHLAAPNGASPMLLTNGFSLTEQQLPTPGAEFTPTQPPSLSLASNHSKYIAPPDPRQNRMDVTASDAVPHFSSVSTPSGPLQLPELTASDLNATSNTIPIPSNFALSQSTDTTDDNVPQQPAKRRRIRSPQPSPPDLVLAAPQGLRDLLAVKAAEKEAQREKERQAQDFFYDVWGDLEHYAAPGATVPHPAAAEKLAVPEVNQALSQAVSEDSLDTQNQEQVKATQTFTALAVDSTSEAQLAMQQEEQAIVDFLSSENDDREIL